jgi:predicted transcriptional regulator
MLSCSKIDNSRWKEPAEPAVVISHLSMGRRAEHAAGHEKPAIDTRTANLYAESMEVQLTPDLEAKLARLAAESGRDKQALAREAIERLVDYDEWFLREVDKGLAAADCGELIDHEDIGKLINRRYPG